MGNFFDEVSVQEESDSEENNLMWIVRNDFRKPIEPQVGYQMPQLEDLKFDHEVIPDLSENPLKDNIGHLSSN